jgi:TolA-binding protein
VEAYRAGRYEEAAELLHAFSLAHASSSFLDDASFLEASSLANAGRPDAAALLAERHLARFPSSFHRKEAAILVARLRRDRGDCDGARKAIAVWMSESPRDARVVAALGGCRSE